MIALPLAPAQAMAPSANDSITLVRPAEYSWKCACGDVFTRSTEERVRASQWMHRGLHRIQVRAISAGDTCFAYRVMRLEPAEGWAPGYNCCPETPTASSERLQQELWTLYREVLDLFPRD